ncbi:MAG: molybdenum ABC transporter ATP-binding protein [Planctomycetes bacterium]|nr:molybdenum ABC transporter ATP-binding protein [Planctomycetota bacterium]
MTHLSFTAKHRFDSGFQLDMAWESDAQVTALFGPSGAGKTSCLNVLCGLLRVREGRIECGGQTWLDTARRIFVPPERRRIGMVFQDQLLFPHRTVADNLTYGLRRHRGGEARVKYDDVVRVLELGTLVDRRPATLSGGERQRVALGRALLAQPQLLLLDEPVSSLDDRLRWQVLDYLEHIVERWQIPALFVSHAQAEVRRLAQYAVVVDAGRVVTAAGVNQALLHRAPLQWRDQLGPINLLRLTNVKTVNGERTGRLGEHVVTLPPPPLESLHVADAVSRDAAAPQVKYAQLDPRDVLLASPGATLDISARNRWPGVVCQVAEVDDGLMVAIDVGQVVWAEVTHSSAQQQQLTVGQRVVCVAKTYSLKVME